MQPHPVELFAGPSLPLRRPLSTPPKLPAAYSSVNKCIQLVELPVSIARPEVIAPAAKHGIQFRDDPLHVPPVLPRISQLSHPVPKLLRRLGAWPPLHEMPARVALNAPPLADRASQEYKALFSASQVHHPRLRGMQCQTQPIHHQPDPSKRFPGPRFRAAHRHVIVGVPDQDPKLATSRRPDPIQFVQVDVGQQRRDHSPYTKGNLGRRPEANHRLAVNLKEWGYCGES